MRASPLISTNLRMSYRKMTNCRTMCHGSTQRVATKTKRHRALSLLGSLLRKSFTSVFPSDDPFGHGPGSLCDFSFMVTSKKERRSVQQSFWLCMPNNMATQTVGPNTLVDFYIPRQTPNPKPKPQAGSPAPWMVNGPETSAALYDG